MEGLRPAELRLLAEPEDAERYDPEQERTSEHAVAQRPIRPGVAAGEEIVAHRPSILIGLDAPRRTAAREPHSSGSTPFLNRKQP